MMLRLQIRTHTNKHIHTQSRHTKTLIPEVHGSSCQNPNTPDLRISWQAGSLAAGVWMHFKCVYVCVCVCFYVIEDVYSGYV
jgi:hypothetical protein